MDQQFVDRALICADCQQPFIFTAGEQLFFAAKAFKNDPKRCKPCTARRNTARRTAPGSRTRPSLIETQAECSGCGIQTTVPFRPTQGRPVLCRSCFQAKPSARKPVQTAAVLHS